MTTVSLKDRVLGLAIGFVPTLGWLHEGHETLIRRAQKENDKVIVSRFVNPLQFRVKAYTAYPMDEKRDVKVCQRLGVDYLFSPRPEDMYPPRFDTAVEVKNLAGKLDGASLRWHYRGVVTVVAKLFNITQPHKAYFGSKDPHQLALIRRMVDDLNFPVKIISVATKRDRDGVALSSRNSLLSPKERAAVKVISKSLKAIESRVKLGETDRARMTSDLIEMIEAEPLAKVDFAAVVDADSLSQERFAEK
ncbi:Pantoate--beta-alanine ligase, partial [hydrothermal vent metagenome]